MDTQSMTPIKASDVQVGDVITWGAHCAAGTVARINGAGSIWWGPCFRIKTREVMHTMSSVNLRDLRGIQLVSRPPASKPKEEVTKYSKYPDGNPKTLVGMTKPPVDCVPATAMFMLGQAFKDGGIKYGPMNWRDDPVTASTYYNAIQRHLMSFWDGEDKAEDSGVHHLAHVMACCAIILDASVQDTLTDDRATPGKLSEWLKANTAST